VIPCTWGLSLGALEKPRKPSQEKSRKTKEEGEETEEEEDDDDEDPQEEIYVSRTTKRHTESTTKEPEGSGRMPKTTTTSALESFGRKRKAPASTTSRLDSKAAKWSQETEGCRKQHPTYTSSYGIRPRPQRVCLDPSSYFFL
jgi:hypothetical protein